MSNNHVTPDTARILKAAGFPQPEFQTGQFWYNSYSALSFVGLDHGNKEFTLHSLTTGRSKKMYPYTVPGDAFAPTTTDILKAINAPGYNLFYNPLSGEYFCNGAAHGRFDFFNHTNPAEAAAQMWLAVNKIK